jgi:hypothetical protein
LLGCQQQQRGNQLKPDRAGAPSVTDRAVADHVGPPLSAVIVYAAKQTREPNEFASLCSQ